MPVPAEILLALAKFEDKDNVVRDAFAAGEYHFDAVVRVRGSMTIGESHEKAVPAAIPWQKLFAVAMSKLNGVTLESIVEEALKGNGRVQALAEDAKERAQEAVSKLVQSTRQTVRGSVKLSKSFEIEEVR